MKVNSIDSKGSFEIVKDENKITEVHYQKSFSSECEADLYGDKIYIKPKDVWQSKFDIYKNEVNIGDITFTWKGEIVIALTPKNEDTLKFKFKAFWNRFEISNEKDELTMTLKPDFSGKTWKYNYEVEFIQNEINENKLVEILIYACFAGNLYLVKQINMQI